MGLFSSKPKINDPYNTMGSAPQSAGRPPKPANSQELAETVDDLEAQRDRAWLEGKCALAQELDEQARDIRNQLNPRGTFLGMRW